MRRVQVDMSTNKIMAAQDGQNCIKQHRTVLIDQLFATLQRHTSPSSLEAAHRRNLGRTGSAVAARLLKAAGDGGESEAERTLHQLLRLHRISGWTPQYRSCGYVIDVAFVAHALAIEVDGWAWHGNVDRFNSDAHRQNILVNAGWHVLRFTWHQLTLTPEIVVTQIAQALSGSR